MKNKIRISPYRNMFLDFSYLKKKKKKKNWGKLPRYVCVLKKLEQRSSIGDVLFIEHLEELLTFMYYSM